ncbi:MAG: NHLP bacteriocin export ABC transporter permease/ATPase subunit [Coriobacteriales bacterium]|nr:NHLP bacteriocin export ABC transporter permease/ATPase subunit [Coriobacteriales bacterium]
MGWFDEQIRQRKLADDAAFEDSFHQIAGAVMGRQMSDALNSDRQLATDAIGEILKYYHVKPREVPDSVKDINEVLEHLMRPSGIMRRTVRLDKGWRKDAVGAMLGTRTDDGSVVALLPSGMAGYKYYDRASGTYVRVNSRNESLIHTEAIAFYKPFPLKKMGIGTLMRYIWEQVAPADLAMLCIIMAFVTLVGMLTPRINAMLFSDVLASGSASVLVGTGIFLLCAMLSSLVFGVVSALVNARIMTKMSVNVEAASMMRMLSLPANFFKNYSAGELSNRLQYMNTLAEQLVSIVLSSALTSVFSLAYVAQIFLYAPALVAPALTVTFLTLAVTIATVLIQVRITRERMLLGSKESGISYSLISGIQKIRLCGAEKRAFGRWGKAYAKQAALTYNPPTLLKVSQVIISAISLVGTMVMYYAAIASQVSIAEYYAFNTAYGMVNAAFLSLASVAASIAQIRPTLEMIKPLMETVPEVSEDKEVVTRLSGGVELNNVTFRYSEDMPPILDNISLKIRPGQYVAIVGKTGCGKSTLMRVMLGFETPQKGAVYYDGRDLTSIDLKSLRRKIGTVMQNGKLFTGNIFSNITISAPWLTLNDAWEAAEIAGLAEDIRHMPMGMHTLISEGQGGVSGGQRQRILIARAVAPKPRLLMFDEATSALDNLTQKQVSEALDKMKCTRIVIAHRLSTIRQCDRIIVLDKGKIVEDGTYEELIAANGSFAELVERQRLDNPKEVSQ